MTVRTRFVQPGKIETATNEMAVIKRIEAAFSFASASILSLTICRDVDKSMFAEKQGFSQKRHSCSGKACNRLNLLHRKVPGLI